MDTFDAFYSYLTKRTGPLATNACFNLLGFINTKNLSDPYTPDIEYLHGCFAKKMLTLPQIFQNFGFNDEYLAQVIAANQDSPIMTMSAILMRPNSHGTVKLRSRNVHDHPLIDLNYLDDDEDVKVLIAGLREYRRLSATQTFAAYQFEDLRFRTPECDALEFDSDAYWRCHVKWFSR